ncbi:MAG: hypothetical protein Q9217_005105 [Psora testacea]
MRETQPEQDDEIQAFRRWFSSSRTRRPGIRGSSHVTQCEFIPPSAVKEYLGANQRVEDLLTSLFGKEASRIIDAEVIREHYIRPLAILLVIGEGPMIKHFVQYRSLQDHRLPYRSCPEDFPFSSDPNFFQHFHNQQWQFCATDLEYNMNLYLHKEEILPIIHKQEIGHGGNAVVFKIIVDEEYNKLVPQRWKMPERPPHLRNTFVLKTYRGADAKEQYKAEHAAFMNLRYDGKPSPFITAYYGSFIDDGTYNIVLEYADRGNFEDFIKTTPEPSTDGDMIEFWDRFCSITHGLALIHGTPVSTPTGIPVLLGWHQDIKPANILVFSRSGTSCYDVYFKLADMSLCHFKQSESLQHEHSDLDAFGTRAYGAPETFRPDVTIDSFPVQVRPDVDIWSMGCLFSEAAVWTRFGWKRVLQYRRQRQDEIKQLLDLDGEHLFHDGDNVLKVVQDIHGHIAETARPIDDVTVEILRLVADDMLLNEDEPRYSAKQVFHRSRRVIKAIRNKFEVSASEVFWRKDEDNGDTSDPEERPKTPPSVPPGYIDGSGASSRVNTSTTARPISMQSASPATSYQSSHIDRFNALSINTRDLDHQQGHGRPQRGTMGETSNEAGSVPQNKASLRRSHTEKKRSNSPRRYSVKYFPGSFSDPPSPNQDSKLPTPPPSSSSDYPHPKSSPAADNHIPPKSKYQRHQEEPKRPHLSLYEGLSWKVKKKNGYPSSLNGQENLTYLNGRDHIFVIDNTESMRAHRNDVLKVISLLTYMLKVSDPNGLDVCFTQATQKVNSGKSTKLSTAVSQVAFRGISDMRTRLSHILQEHKNKFGTTTTPSGSWYRNAGPPEAQKPLSFYVLTDGKWQPNDVGPIIIALVESMRANHLPKDHVGIQFIRFGEDSRGIDRLNHLDHGLGLKDIDMDIVDTTFWNGNIWKQLLGALNSWYDDDPD